MKIPYGNNFLDLKIPKDVNVDTCKPDINENTHLTKDEMIRRIIKSEEWTQFLSYINGTNSSILIIVNDATRATPTKFVLEYILPEITKNKYKFEFLIATGSHRAAKEEELETIFGLSILKSKPIIFNHDYDSSDDLVYCGISPTFETEIWVNKLLFDKKYSKIITINSVEPHYFGGWTGGRKSIIPGCAGKKTITGTHKHALSSESKICKLIGNPVHDDFMECLNIVLSKLNKPVYSIQLLQDSKKNLADMFGGNIISSFESCVNKAKKIFQILVSKNYDLVILVVYPPLDQNFYQSHKAVENSRLILSQETSILLISPCTEGIGPQKFLEPINLFYNKETSYNDFFQYIKDNYQLGYHKSAKLIEISLRNQLAVKCEIKLSGKLSNIITPVENIQNFVDNLKQTNKNLKNILVVLDAGVTVPIPT